MIPATVHKFLLCIFPCSFYITLYITVMRNVSFCQFVYWNVNFIWQFYCLENRINGRGLYPLWGNCLIFRPGQLLCSVRRKSEIRHAKALTCLTISLKSNQWIFLWNTIRYFYISIPKLCLVINKILIVTCLCECKQINYLIITLPAIWNDSNDVRLKKRAWGLYSILKSRRRGV